MSTTPRTDAEWIEVTSRLEAMVVKEANGRIRIAQLERELEEARKSVSTCQNCHHIGVQLDLIRDELKRIEARVLESEFSEDPRLSNILEYCRRSQRDIPTFYSVIGERDRLEAENLKLRIKLEDQHAAMVKAMEALDSCRMVVQNEINVREMLGKPTQVWPDLLNGCVSGGGIESALTTITAALEAQP